MRLTCVPSTLRAAITTSPALVKIGAHVARKLHRYVLQSRHRLKSVSFYCSKPDDGCWTRLAAIGLAASGWGSVGTGLFRL